MRYSHYTIQHIDLSVPIQLPEPESRQYYFVFWYDTIPLGEIYVSNQEIKSEVKFATLCWRAIAVALKRHASAQRFPDYDLSSFDEIRQTCHEILHALVEGAVSSECPVSVVICTRDRAEILVHCLTALSHQRCAPKEIIVVDNASKTSGTRDVVAMFSNVRYVREDRPGLDVARNRGVKEASYPIVAFTDDDTKPHPHWVSQIARSFDDPHIDAMTGLVLAASLQTEAEIIFERHWPFNRGYVKKIYDQAFFKATLQKGPPVWEIGAGANMAFRKSVFQQVGFFDERLDVGAAGCSGDSEMWYRILANRKSVLYNPLAVVHHFHRSSVEGLKRQLFHYMKGFTVAILIQYNRFGHRGNLIHLFKSIPIYYLRLFKRGFPKYSHQYQTLFWEVRGLFAGLIYYVRHRNADPGIL